MDPYSTKACAHLYKWFQNAVLERISIQPIKQDLCNVIPKDKRSDDVSNDAHSWVRHGNTWALGPRVAGGEGEGKGLYQYSLFSLKWCVF